MHNMKTALGALLTYTYDKQQAQVAPTEELPACLTASFAFYLAFYRGTELTEKGLTAKRPNGDIYIISDDKNMLEFFYATKMPLPKT